jgi:hypothetical protein
MKRLALPLLVLVLIAGSVAAAWFVLERSFGRGGGAHGGSLATVERALPPFTKLHVAGIADIRLVQGAADSVTLEGPENELARMRTEVRDGTLEIANRGRTGFFSFVFGGGPRPLRATVTFRELQGIEASGAVKLRSDGLKADALKLAISGEGSLAMAGLDVRELAVVVSGAVKADIAGRATDQRIAISGAGAYRAAELASENAKVAVSGAGKVVVNASKTLKVDISGAGTVDYLGNPKVTQEISGVGRVRRRDSAAIGAPGIA